MIKLTRSTADRAAEIICALPSRTCSSSCMLVKSTASSMATHHNRQARG
jgi:hypothetical protein